MNYIINDIAERDAITTMVADDTCFITSTSETYTYIDDAWVLTRSGQPLVFKGFTFEQTDSWQNPESVFKGFSFEIADKSGGSKPLFQGIV